MTMGTVNKLARVDIALRDPLKFEVIAQYSACNHIYHDIEYSTQFEA